MSTPRYGRLGQLSAILSLALLTVGCPHRSPLWSPNGKWLLVLTGGEKEDVDKAASQMWLVDTASHKAQRIELPEAGTRFLSAVWLSDDTFVAFTGRWVGDFVEAGTEKTWRRKITSQHWERLPLPAPNETRATRRMPVLIETAKGPALVYPHSDEAMIAAALKNGEELFRLPIGEVVGPAPRGGFLAYRPEPGDTGGFELVAYGPDFKERWVQRLSALRKQVAKILGKRAVQIVFNDVSTSHLPFHRAPEKPTTWVGVNLIFSDVGWKAGIPGYYVQLGGEDGSVKSVVNATGLSGQPALSGGLVWAVLAPTRKPPTPVRLTAIDAASRKPKTVVPLNVKKEQIYGYALDPAGKRFALSIRGAPCTLRIYETGDLQKPRVVELK